MSSPANPIQAHPRAVPGMDVFSVAPIVNRLYRGLAVRWSAIL